MNLSAVIITKNEEANIQDCIQSLNFCGEIIVIDDFSIDKTREIAKRLGARVYKRKLDGNFAAQRNYGLKKAKESWVLFVDADERVSSELGNEIIKTIKTTNLMGFYLKRDDYLWGKRLKHGETGRIRLLRLARRKAGKWIRTVHETWSVNGRTGQFKNALCHYSHPTLLDFLASINYMSTLHAKANSEEGKRANLTKIIIWPVGKFFQNYIFKKGFLDGGQGFIVAAMMSLHSYLAWSKLWLLQRK